MGQRIQSYSLSELKKISVRSEMPPYLFWALPIGAWNPQEIEDLWRYFKYGTNESRDYGLILVNEAGGNGPTHKINLQSVGAKLEEVVPKGLRGPVLSSAFDGARRRILVFSGGYPQPGWGVLVECADVEESFGLLIHQAIESLDLGGDRRTRLKPFTDAQRYSKLFRVIRSMEKLVGSGGLKQILLDYDKLIAQFEMAREAFDGVEYYEGANMVGSVKEVLDSTTMAGLDPDKQRQFKEWAAMLASALSIRQVAPETLATEIAPIVEKVVANPEKRKIETQKLEDEKKQSAFIQCLNLRLRETVTKGGSFDAWAEGVLSTVPRQCADALDEHIKKLKEDLPEARNFVSGSGERGHIAGENEKGQRNEDQDFEREEASGTHAAADASITSVSELRAHYHKVMGEAAELQYELGAQFLVNVEKRCQAEGLWKRTIPWDPARMVGWKLHCAGQSVKIFNLEYVSKRFATDLDIGVNPLPNSGNADGAHFTDYVHALSTSGSEVDTRKVTIELLEKLLLPLQKIDLISTYGGTAAVLGGKALEEQLLETFGWHSVGEAETPLAGCIEKGIEQSWDLKKEFSASEVRISLESFCKDILDVVVSKLGYSHQEVLAVVQERCAGYKWHAGEKDWGMEMEMLTSGSAAILIGALAPLVFPEKGITLVVSKLGKLGEILNSLVHHFGASKSVVSPDQVPILIRQLLDCAAEAFGEMPWHLAVDRTFGGLPKVLSGNAWSHGSPDRKRLKVILWDGDFEGPHVTIWNRTRRNPVITDPVFISRPSRPSRHRRPSQPSQPSRD